jgi:hypothetical protein
VYFGDSQSLWAYRLRWWNSSADWTIYTLFVLHSLLATIRQTQWKEGNRGDWRVLYYEIWRLIMHQNYIWKYEMFIVQMSSKTTQISYKELKQSLIMANYECFKLFGQDPSTLRLQFTWKIKVIRVSLSHISQYLRSSLWGI